MSAKGNPLRSVVLRRHGAASLTMLAGVSAVFALLYYMNELTQPPKPDPKKEAVDFAIEKRAPKKKPQPKQQPKKVQKTVRSTSVAPAPNISSALSGLSFDLPQFEGAGLDGSDRLLESAGGDKKLVMTGDSVDVLPKPLTRKQPEYPRKAHERGIEGFVTLQIKVSEHGDVDSVRVTAAEPVGIFEEVAIAAVRQWNFEPARYQGEAVAVAVSQKIPFRLSRN